MRDARLCGITVALGSLIQRVQVINDVPGNRARSILADAGIVEGGQTGMAIRCHQYAVRCKVAWNHSMSVSMIQGCEDSANDAQFLIVGQGQGAFLDVLPQRLSGNIFCHQNQVILIFSGEEFPHGENVGVRWHVSYSAVGVTYPFFSASRAAFSL